MKHKFSGLQHCRWQYWSIFSRQMDRRTDSIQRAKHICYMLSRAKTLLSIYQLNSLK